MLKQKFKLSWPKNAWEEEFLKFSQKIVNNTIYLLLKGVVLNFYKFDSPFAKECFVSSLVNIGLAVLKKTLKMWKVYQQTDDRQNVTRKSVKKVFKWKRAKIPWGQINPVNNIFCQKKINSMLYNINYELACNDHFRIII